MIKSRRRKIGIVFMLVALAALPILALLDVPLLTTSSAYFVETGTTTQSLEWHWPLALIAALFLVGIILIVFPHRERNT